MGTELLTIKIVEGPQKMNDESGKTIYAGTIEFAVC
jgi:hypothetical protein